MWSFPMAGESPGGSSEVPGSSPTPVAISVCFCHHKAPRAGLLKQWTFTVPQGWRLDMQDQGVGRTVFS